MTLMRLARAEQIFSRRIGGPVCQRWVPIPFVERRKIALLRRRDAKCRATETGNASFQTAKEAVDAGLVALEKKSNPKKAIELFCQALEMNPTDQEASAAVYNIACCYVEMEEWQKAADQIVMAVNDYRLDIEIPRKDADMRSLRARPEWEDAMTKVKGGMTSSMRYNMIGELRAPFRFFRFYIFGGLSVGAGVGLIFIGANLFKVIQSGDPIQEPLQNLAINFVALVVLSVLFFRDYQSREKEKESIEREEKLSNLQVERKTGKAIPLYELRGTFRPVIICGSKSFCRRSIDAARPYFSALKERGVAGACSNVPLLLAMGANCVVVVPVALVDVDERLKSLKEDFQSTSTTSGFGEPAKTETKPQSRWELTPVQIDEWKTWLMAQKTYSGLEERDFYLQVQLDGSVRASGSGMPPWNSIVSDLPPLEDIRTKLTDNIGF